MSPTRCVVARRCRRRRQPGGVLATLRSLAAAQDGVLSLADARGCGVAGEAIHSAVRRGRLVPVHRGVFTLPGQPLTARGAARAAILAIGHPAAVASHASAARVHGLAVLAMPGAAAVTVRAEVHRAARPGLAVHRSTELAARDVSVSGGLRVTTVHRTLTDLLTGTDRLAAVWACEAALRRRLVTAAELAALVTGLGHRPGGARARR